MIESIITFFTTDWDIPKVFIIGVGYMILLLTYWCLMEGWDAIRGKATVPYKGKKKHWWHTRVDTDKKSF